MNVFLIALQEAPVEEINFGMLILRMLVFLGLVILLIWLLLRKFLPMIARAPGFRNRNVKILERVPLDTKRSLLVVEIQERVYLLGSAEGQINVLMELDREKMSVAPSITSVPGSFDQVFRKVFTKSRSTEPPKN
ncbi:MAG TPA: flagellar biosynthetic protein FliO [Acidobacteriota bacterium]|nr:flagellar biosynthetic protein FliO [Acidobacteriota bacterium]